MQTLSDEQILDSQIMGWSDSSGDTWVMTGRIDPGFSASSATGAAVRTNETYRALVGPGIAAGARAAALATIAAVDVVDRSGYAIGAVEADIDDESNRVQLTFELSAVIEGAPGSTADRRVNVRSVLFHITVRTTPLV